MLWQSVSLCAGLSGCATAVALLSLSVILVLLWLRPRNIPRYEDEWYYIDSATNEKRRFPSYTENVNGDIAVSLIVPAYNEEERLPEMLRETFTYLQKRQKEDNSYTYELIVVDDGSSDGTFAVGQEANRLYGSDHVRVLKECKNRGKGGAVRLGMQSARGRRLLMVDADGATKIEDLKKLEDALNVCEKDSLGVAVGSRAHMQEDAVVQRSFFRNLLMYGFHFLVATVGGVRHVKDTQCGFKLFTRRSAQALFSNMHVERWCFDVELLYLAQRVSMPVVEVAVNWTEKAGSKLDPAMATLEMLKDLLVMRGNYMLGLWPPPTLDMIKKNQ